MPRIHTLDILWAGGTTAFRVMLPENAGAWGVVLFSHGANSSNACYDRMWSGLTARGFMVIGPNHPDSGPPERQARVGRGELWRARLAQTSLPLLERDRFDAVAAAHGGVLDWRCVCAAGHSFGAVVAQALSGATLLDPVEQRETCEGRPEIGACMAFSPPGPRLNFIPDHAWSSVTLPCLLQTGDNDILPGFVDDWRSRLIGFADRPDRYRLVLCGVDHYFGGLICRLRPASAADEAALTITVELAGLFLDAYLRKDPAARRALDSQTRQTRARRFTAG